MNPNALASIDLAPTLIFIFVTTFTPGPNNILSGSMGIVYGYRRTLPFMLGVVTGFLIIMLLAASLTTAVTSFIPLLSPLLRVLGSTYILWLAYGVFSATTLGKGEQESQPPSFKTGLLLQFVNPKAVFYGLTVFSTFLAPMAGETFTFTVVPCLLGLVTFAAISSWALGGDLIKGWLNTPRRMKIVGTIMALALVYTAADLLGLIDFLLHR